MSGWISSKLKVAETFLQQIDQQAAESLKKGEIPQGREPDNVSTPRSLGAVPLKDQLKRRTPDTDHVVGKLRNDPNFNPVSNRDQNKEISKLSITPKSNLTDSDWTELLGSPSQSAASTSSRRNGVSLIRGTKRDAKKSGSLSSHFSGLEAKRNQKINSAALKSVRQSGLASGGSSDGKPSDGEEPRKSSVELQSNDKFQKGQGADHKSTNTDLIVESERGGDGEHNGVLDFNGNGVEMHSGDVPQEVVSPLVDENHLLGSVSGSSIIDKSKAASEGPITDDMNRGSSSSSDGRSDSELDSGSSSGSESEREREERRERRQQVMAERVAAKAVESIKERENMVARLEGEKESLEKIIEERAKQQAKEASELQTTMMETMEAVEKEKQKHNNTRMEVLARLAKLETANADLARSLASSQWNLEVEVNQVVELRQQMEAKQAAHEELKRRISNTYQAGSSLNRLAASKGVEFEREILEAECSYVADKIGRLRDKAKKMEANIEMTQKEMGDPTEVEIELRRRLGQLTDHLIQKQAQVEALSSEKATLQFRTEAVSRMLEENNSMLNTADVSSTSLRFDLESGKWDLSKAELRPMFEERIRSGGQHLGSLLRQLDAIFFAGAVFLRRNPTARLWSAVYLVGLHFWVIYILTSHSPAPNEPSSGAVISLENINNTGV